MGSNLKLPRDDYREYVALGKIKGHTPWFKYGKQDDFDIADAGNEVWDVKAPYTYLTSATQLFLSSSSALDTVQVRVKGLDENWYAKTETINLTGQSQVALPGTWMRINTMQNIGSSATAGDVYCAESDTLTGGIPDTTSKIKAKFHIASQRTEMAVYAVADSASGEQRGLLHKWKASLMRAGTARVAEVKIMAREFGGVFYDVDVAQLGSGGTSTSREEFRYPWNFPPKTDIVVIANYLSINNCGISASFETELIDEV